MQMPGLVVSVIAFHCETLELRGDSTASRPLNCQQPIDLKDRANRKETCERLTPSRERLLGKGTRCPLRWAGEGGEGGVYFTGRCISHS